ncbi:MAG TPA: 6-pyruvoyl-tetrahydropterin synthase-related protein [Terriglobales bacterium]
MEVLRQWKLGILHPKWAALAHYGYGEARFIFYPPVSWTLGTLLGSFLPWKLVAGAYVWIGLTASGFCMFLLAREWLGRTEAICAAVFYAANPYFLVIVYWRSAFAELVAGALLPLLVLVIFRPRERPKEIILPLALIVAAAWLINVPSAVMVTYSAAFFVLMLALSRRALRGLAEGAAGILLGPLLAGFYLVPAVYEQKWISVSQVLSEGYRAQDNFLFAITPDPDHNLFNHLISIIALSEVIALCAAAFLVLRHKPRARFFSLLAIWGIALSISMFSVTSIFWRYLPELRFMQFPWRWLLCLNVPLAIFAARTGRRWLPRIALYLLLLATVGYVWHTVQAPWWDNAADIAEMLDNQTSGVGYEGTDEYVPAGADASAAKPGAPDVRYEGEGAGSAQIAVHRWDPETRAFTVIANDPGKMAIRLFNFPAWQVRVNERITPSETDPETGQMMVPVQAGTNRVEIQFIKTWDRTLGEIVSAITAIFLLLLVVYQRKLSRKEVIENRSHVYP